MGKETKIEWTDSTLNLMMGCDGCELWNAKAGIKKCYAGVLTERHGGMDVRGWPEAFDKPKIFMERLKPMLDWKDLTGTERPDKPWLNGYPRTIFLDDMGDTFTESLPLDWLAPAIPEMEKSPHIYQLLTKRPKRMKAFFEQFGYVPKNFWLLTTVTSASTLGRVADLLSIEGASVRGVSAEPLWGAVDFLKYLLKLHCQWCNNKGITINGKCSVCDGACRAPHLSWVIGGFESGQGATPGHPDWARRLRDDCVAAGVPFFWKQWGEYLPISQLKGETDYLYHPAPSRDPEAARRCKVETAVVQLDGSIRDDYPPGAMLTFRVGKKAAGRLLDGRTWDEMPKVAEVAS